MFNTGNSYRQVRIIVTRAQEMTNGIMRFHNSIPRPTSK